MRPTFFLRRPPPSSIPHFFTPRPLLRPQPSSLRQLLSRPLFRPRRHYANQPAPNPTPHLNSPPSLTLSQRMRKLSREYGWSAVGVYFALSALDFPFCFLAVRIVGTDRIGYAEGVVVGWFWAAVGKVAPGWVEGRRTMEMAVEGEAVKGEGWGVEKARERNEGENASIWTQLALAYAIHKSFIFIRVPLTAAVTPKVVKTLRGWGWNIGKRKQ
ncbi:hypothetical protein K461DRAFT_224395 [Myriangium duriaei CBS 260.36]|uniref:DUF1279 domain-containing protein n=1 Tax=Myriangium duriaei CBS 260.36 TaxID=1168546 RepID=A0A9P4MMR9_9PEZI|nr:hypothetical protein K461DRAFT_224395 [Myriangium duriaei CBS 260.36]